MNTNMTMVDDHRRLIASFDEGGESREVWIGRGDGRSLEVGEVTCGELTKQVYGETRHDHRVLLGVESLAMVPQVLACVGEDPEDALVSLLSSEDVFLSDLMDSLDAHGIPYTYLSISQRGGSFRPAGRCS